jgi:uncharacterized protein (DUF58 family)
MRANLFARLIPTRLALTLVAALACAAAAALIAGAPSGWVTLTAASLLVAAAVAAGGDLWLSGRRWRASPLRVEHRWPEALAVGVRRAMAVAVINDGRTAWRISLFDAVDPTIGFEGLPQSLLVPAERRVEVAYSIVPYRRGTVRFGAAQLRVRTRVGLFELLRDAGAAHEVRVYPNFAAVARYAWLSGDRRLTEIGIKTYVRRGAGTDFKQLSEYRQGDPIRHIDWKATMRASKPIVREFEDSRDQRVLFLLDCGRRMRADEGTRSVDGSHFDQALNALMLLSYVALKEGDEVGAMTFGSLDGAERHFAPTKGVGALNAIMARLYDVEASASHSDYQLAARDLMRAHAKRALVIVLTNFRDEDVPELQPALKLMRTRHLVLLASLRERVQRELAERPLKQPFDAVVAAGAHLFAQSRRDAFRRMVGADPLAIDVEPSQLAVALVNHYHAVKRARLL